MKFKNVFCLGVLTIFLFGCNSPEEQKNQTSENFKKPEFVGTLPDGRVIMRVWVVRKYNRYNHAVYFFMNGGREITVNHSVPEGKTTRNEVIVLLDGIPVSTNIIKQ